MTEEEIMERAREAAIDAMEWGSGTAEPVRTGVFDDNLLIVTAARALRDLSKPLADIRPVDPDLIEARKIAASVAPPGTRYLFERGFYDDGLTVRTALAAIKRGRELERGR